MCDSSSSLHFLFPCSFSGTVEGTDIINTPLEPLWPADVFFGGFVDIAPHFGGEIPPKPQFLGHESASSSQTGKILKVSCYRKYCIDFNQIWRNDRDHQVVIVGGPGRRPTNPRWRTAAILKKTLNHHLSATVRPILMKFSTMTHIGLWHRMNR